MVISLGFLWKTTDDCWCSIKTVVSWWFNEVADGHILLQRSVCMAYIFLLSIDVCVV